MQKFLPKIVVLSICIFAFHLPGLAQDNTKTKPLKEKIAKTDVYVCDSKSSTAYHSTSSCSGIKKCKHEILKVTKDEAINEYNRRACKICY